jgi:excisionase family DNA binding protein
MPDEREPHPKQARFLTVAQIAAELGMSERTVYRHIDEMHPVCVGSAIRVARTDFENWIRSRRDAAPSGARRSTTGARPHASYETSTDELLIRPITPRGKRRPSASSEPSPDPLIRPIKPGPRRRK